MCIVHFMRNQSCLIDCPYCTWIRSELKGKLECPICNGKGQIQKPYRMMDKNTSDRQLLMQLIRICIPTTENPDIIFSKLLQLLEQIDLYSFNIKRALIDYLKEIDRVEEA